MNRQNLSSLMPPENYWQPGIFVREKESVFASHWVFAGLKQQLSEHNSYISFTIAGLPVIVRNMKDRLVAFRNICSHRHSIIHPEGCGKAAFRCPYHGWTYDADGVPIGIPNNEASFGFDKEAKKALALDPVAVDTCGNLVFVRLGSGASLKEWLGPLAADLEHVSTLMTDIYASDSQLCKANWKATVEIALEGYHEPYVHPTTFAAHVGARPDIECMSEEEIAALAETVPLEVPEGAPTDDMTIKHSIDYHGAHSVSAASLSAHTSNYLQSVAQRIKLPRSPVLRGLNHYFVYPNLQICVYSGINASIVRYDPQAEDRTKIDTWFLAGMPADQNFHGGIMWRATTKHWLDVGKKVMAEDIVACEATQAGMRYASELGFLGEAEQRVRHFQSTLLEEKGCQEKAA